MKPYLTLLSCLFILSCSSKTETVVKRINSPEVAKSDDVNPSSVNPGDSNDGQDNTGGGSGISQELLSQLNSGHVSSQSLSVTTESAPTGSQTNIYVAISDESEAALIFSTELMDTKNLIFCAKDHLEECAKGKGRFHTTSFQQDYQSRKYFKATEYLAVADGDQFSVIAIDDRGSILAEIRVKLTEKS